MSCLNPLKVTVSPFLDREGKHKLIFGYFQEMVNPADGSMAEHYLIPCGHCSECQKARRREWSDRLSLEASIYKPSEVYFLTLTYDDAHIDLCGQSKTGLYNLNYEHFREFTKQLRLFYQNCYKPMFDGFVAVPDKFRFFLCGEYGDHTFRPHAHVISFGLDFLSTPGAVSLCNRSGAEIFHVPLFGDLWPYGHVDCCRAQPGSFRYVAGYVLKKLDKLDKYDSLGLVPERAIMSKKPAIGVPFFEANKDLIRETGVYIDPFDGSMRDIPRFALRSVFADDPGFVAIVNNRKRSKADRRLSFLDQFYGERAEDAQRAIAEAEARTLRPNHRSL